MLILTLPLLPQWNSERLFLSFVILEAKNRINDPAYTDYETFSFTSVDLGQRHN